jgi:nucleoside-diphosphate-sugar epimerase
VGVKLCKIDIANEDAVRVALNRVDWLFHCAYDSEDIEWNYRAVRALIASCHENKLRRFIHVSSFVVYDLPAEGELTEETIETTAKSGYAHVKRQLEVELLSAERREHLPVTILQPTIVYGPFSKPWTIDPVNMLVNGTVVLPDRGEGICNAVYVDDVVEAMIRAARKPSAAGRRYLVSGEPVTWSQFYEAVAEAADARPPIYMPTEMILRRNARVARLLRQLTSPWPLARRIAQQKIIRGILQDGAKVLPAYHRARVLAQLFGPPALRLDYVHLPDRGHLEFLRSSFTVNLTKARREIDYAPRHSFSGGMAKTAVYIKNYLGREREKHGI